MADGGCLKTEQVNPGEPVGTDWSDIVRDILSGGAERARAYLQTRDDAGAGEVTVRIEMSAFLRFAHRGVELMDEGIVSCVCTNDGTVCVCRGQCDFDACCDPPPAGPIVA